MMLLEQNKIFHLYDEQCTSYEESVVTKADHNNQEIIVSVVKPELEPELENIFSHRLLFMLSKRISF